MRQTWVGGLRNGTRRRDDRRAAGGKPKRRAEARRYVIANCSMEGGEDGYVEFGIVLLDVSGAVLGAEFFGYGGDLLGVRDGSRFEFGCVAAGIDSERGVL